MQYINRLVAALPTSRGQLVIPRAGGALEISFAELSIQVTRLRRRLAEMGLKRGDIAGICSANSAEWVVLDLACIAMGICTAPFDINADYDADEIFRTYGLACLFTDRESLCTAARTYRMSEVAAWAAAGDHAATQAPQVTYRGNDELTWKFTSGSTGTPKVLAARVSSIDDSIGLAQDMFRHLPGDRLFVFLPLSLLQQRFWIYSAIIHQHDVVITRYEYAFHALKATRPTVVMGVPGFFDALKSFYEQSVPPEQRSDDSLAAFLGGRVRYLWTGSAPANRETLVFFEQAGIAIYEGYGLNETCIVAKNSPLHRRTGSVGRIVPNKSVSFDAAGQILVKSRYPINARYAFCAPGESESTFMGDGVVATGDVGHLDDDGFLFITGRVKELIAMSSGKKVHPRQVEAHVETSDQIANVMVHGSGRPWLVAVVVPRHADVSPAGIQQEVNRLNAGLPAEQKIKRIVLATEPFTRENGLLTSQYKLKRDAITQRYAAQINSCYSG